MPSTQPQPRAQAAKRFKANTPQAAMPQPRSSRSSPSSLSSPSVLILQGGGALGAYQAGAYEALLKNKIEFDWVIGTSIGAINGALIAGNPPERRLENLHAFWHSLSTPLADDPLQAWSNWMPWLQNWASSNSTLNTLNAGVPHFFTPRVGAAWNIHAQVPATQASFYDTSLLKASLERFVDFDYLNQNHCRLSVCAVDVETAEFTIFDTAQQPLHAGHIMASGALPPGFAPVSIEGRLYWDGGIVSNTPLEVLLNDPVVSTQSNTLCWMIDLWDATENSPHSIAAAMTRSKSVQYASRATQQLHEQKRIQDLQRVIEALGQQLPINVRKQTDVQALLAQGHARSINVIHLVHKALPSDDVFKDIDFSESTVTARWHAGGQDALRALKHQAWLQPLPPHTGLVIHELPQI